MGRQNLINALERDNKELEFSDECAIQSSSIEEEDKALLDALRKKNELQDEAIKDLQQDREQRKVLSYALFGFMCFYMLVALVIVFCCGFNWMRLSDMVLITLLTTTLADVIGIFGFVAKYLYHNK